MELADNYCAVSRSSPLRYTAALYDDNHVVNENYSINAGVLLYNISQIVKDNKTIELIKLNRYTKKLPAYLDQDILTDVLNLK